ncbi:MAG: winged helix DNA-binding domain-containing protein [Solirubrobacterales bacterium]|nr:winged helix DNA-binding domain-containing protein [Solirubrobacterales bacterium]
MDALATIRRRLASQRLAGEPLGSAADAVRWSGAVQAQEFAEVKWSLGERVGEVSDAEIERAFAAGEILRTHVMRPTWHLVAAEDIRWLLRLTASRVHAASRYGYGRAGLDGPTLSRCHEVIARELAAGEPRTRKELAAALARDGIEGDSIRLGYVFMHAEVEQLVCSGPRRGRHQTYMLLDHRAAADSGPSGDAALAELARRYLRSHGPATARDFSWWSGLTVTQARQAIGFCGPTETVDDDGTAWFELGSVTEAPARNRALLLPTYDEMIVAYKDLRVDLVAAPPMEGMLTRTIAIDGRTVGGWKRTLSARSVTVEATVLAPLGGAQRAALERTVARFGAFLDLDAELELTVA